MGVTALVCGCAPTPVEPTSGGASPTGPTATKPSTSPSPTPAATTTTGASRPPATPRPGPTDDRSGSQLDEPFEVDGIILVSPDHRITAAYVPPWAGQKWGLKPEALEAFERLSRDAAADGQTLEIRSAYRDFATQKASFEQAMRDYDEETARKYFAEAGASEHQTGLSLDAWDGVHRGSAFTALPEAKWLGKNAYRYGFIIRYPKGKTDITGFAHESWHLRWVGTSISKQFGPDSALTLEEYLGVA